MTRLMTVLVLVALLALSGCADDGRPDNPHLRAELLRMLEQDQSVRRPDAPQEAWDRYDRAHAERMRQILDRYGWPGHELVGKDGAHAAWVIIQHTDLQPDLQRRGLRMMTEAVERGDADPSDLAYLVDRVRVAEGKPQVYGTQWNLTDKGVWRPNTPIEDEARVDERRAKAGLKPLKDYLKELDELE